MSGTYFEDFAPGQVHELGRHAVSEEEIVAYARQWDPQPFHVDPEAAKESVFGGLIASGGHTVAIWVRLYVEALLLGGGAMGSPGIEELRWHSPVRPGDILQARLTVLEARPSARNPSRGTVRSRAEVVNQEGTVVMSMLHFAHFGRRTPG
jgi:acyl dehydratase